MVYSIDFMHLNYDHISPMQFYIVAYRCKEEVLSFPTMCHSSNFVPCIKFKGSGYNRSLTCEGKSALGINTISPINDLMK